MAVEAGVASGQSGAWYTYGERARWRREAAATLKENPPCASWRRSARILRDPHHHASTEEVDAMSLVAKFAKKK